MSRTIADKEKTPVQTAISYLLARRSDVKRLAIVWEKNDGSHAAITSDLTDAEVVDLLTWAESVYRS